MNIPPIKFIEELNNMHEPSVANEISLEYYNGLCLIVSYTFGKKDFWLPQKTDITAFDEAFYKDPATVANEYLLLILLSKWGWGVLKLLNSKVEIHQGSPAINSIRVTPDMAFLKGRFSTAAFDKFEFELIVEKIVGLQTDLNLNECKCLLSINSFENSSNTNKYSRRGLSLSEVNMNVFGYSLSMIGIE